MLMALRFEPSRFFLKGKYYVDIDDVTTTSP